MGIYVRKNRDAGCAGTFAVLFLAFAVLFVLKVAGIGPVAEWSWWWVTCPLWAAPAAIAALLLGLFLIGCVAALL